MLRFFNSDITDLSESFVPVCQAARNQSATGG